MNSPLLGWRYWFAFDSDTEPRLISATRATVWLPDKAIAAECRRDDPMAYRAVRPASDLPMEHPENSFLHAAPAAPCSCGIYAFDTLEGLDELNLDAYLVGQRRCVRGLALGWGRVIVHRSGWRAQHARPLALLSAADSRVSGRIRDAYEEFLGRLARAYRVPILTRQGARAVASEWAA